MRRKYVKKQLGQITFSQLIRPFYKVLYFFILFFIFIGDSIRYFIATSFIWIIRAAYSIKRIIYKTLRNIFKGISIVLRYAKKLTKIRLPKISLPQITFPHITFPHVNIPRITIPRPTIHLPEIEAPKIEPITIRIQSPFARKRGRPRKSIYNYESIVSWMPKIRLPSFHLPTFSPRISIFAVTTRFKYFTLGVFFAGLIAVGIQSYMFIKSLPSPRLIGSVNYPLTTHLFDRNGKLLYEIYHDENRTPVSIQSLPAYVAQATIAIEDKDFPHHKGVSLYSGIIRAAKEIVLHNNFQGGSTITQQLVKSALLTPERTITRKVKEILLALWTEQIYTKQQILQMYLNQVAYGGSSYGIEEASKTYFGKDAKDLTLDEAALLAGLPQAPSLYSPYTNPDGAISRRNEVLKKMREQGYISEEAKEKAEKTPLAMVPLKTNIKAPHFVFYVKQELEDTYGIQQVEEGGFNVTTTLDLNIQQAAEKILKEEIEKVKSLDVSNGGILVTKPATGEIVAMVGSVDYFSAPSGAFNVTTALRQPGSSIKPLMYSLALQRGYTAASIIDDSPVTFGVPGGAAYRPVNYDGKFHGKVPLRFALANSYNIPAVKVLNSLGVDQFVNYAQNMGISTWRDSSQFGLSLTLGGGEVTMVDMATAYGVFANKGYRVIASGIDKVMNTHGDTVYDLSPVRTKVVDEGNAYVISDILSDNFARQWAFGPHSLLEIPGYKVAVKTGTTDSKKDNWTIGYTPEYLVAVWVGNNDNHPMNPNLTSGVTGAAPIWNRVMQYVLKNYSNPNVWFSQPSGVTDQVCYFGRKEYFVKGSDKNTFCRKDILDASNPSVKPSPVN